MWEKDKSLKLAMSFFVSLHQWKRSGGERAVDPIAQLMITCESPYTCARGIPIIWEEERSSHKLSSSAFVLVPYPTPSEKSKQFRVSGQIPYPSSDHFSQRYIGRESCEIKNVTNMFCDQFPYLTPDK